MKSTIKVLAVAVLLSALAGSAYFMWSNFFGTALDNRVREGGAAAKSARAAADRIEDVIAKAEGFPKVWAGLTFDEESEAKRILEDKNSNRGYKVDALRDPSAARIQKDIIDAEIEMNSAIADARKAIKAIDKASWYLPAPKLSDYQAAKDDANRAVKMGESLAANLEQLKYDVDIWGFLSLSLRINGLLMVLFDKSSADLADGDYASAAAGALDLRNGVNESATWLTYGKQELTNVSVYSTDSDAILAFISDAKTTAECFNNAAAAGARGDALQLKAAQGQAFKALAELKKTVAAESTGTDFITWFRAVAERRLKNSKP